MDPMDLMFPRDEEEELEEKDESPPVPVNPLLEAAKKFNDFFGPQQLPIVPAYFCDDDDDEEEDDDDYDEDEEDDSLPGW